MKVTEKLNQLLMLIVCVLIISSLAIVKQSEWMGMPLGSHSSVAKPADNDTLRTLPDGTIVVNTTELASDVRGFGGKVPLEISIKHDTIINVKALNNAETKDFFDRASTLLDLWKGKTIEEARTMKVDAVSGATFSSRGIIGNMQSGIDYISRRSDSSAGVFASLINSFDCSAKNIVGLVVVLLAAILPLFIKNKRYRFCQLVLNVVVLGFWCGAFLSYSSLIGFVASGMNIGAMIILFIMLIAAFIYPLFGKKSYYCTNICPFGSLQMLAGKAFKFKFQPGQRTLRRLDVARQVLWTLLMLFVWSGVWSKWIDYEPFSAFIVNSASTAALVIAVVFFALSFVVVRPYCRFVCPMGTLLKISQTSK